jgi:hypothetical protein
MWIVCHVGALFDWQVWVQVLEKAYSKLHGGYEVGETEKWTSTQSIITLLSHTLQPYTSRTLCRRLREGSYISLSWT